MHCAVLKGQVADYLAQLIHLRMYNTHTHTHTWWERSVVRLEVGVWLKEGVVMAAHPSVFHCTTAHPEVQQHLQVPEAESTYACM